MTVALFSYAGCPHKERVEEQDGTYYMMSSFKVLQSVAGRFCQQRSMSLAKADSPEAIGRLLSFIGEEE